MFGRPRAKAAGALPAAAIAVLAVACASPTSPDLVVDPVQIESVDVLILESSPPQAVAHIEGWLGDGCTEFHSLTQARSGDVITVTILKQRPREAVCTAIAKLYEENVPLQGQYPPGRYVLRVNELETTFTTQ